MTWRLSTFWFLYMGGMGIFFPYYGLYLQDGLGWSEGRVGFVLAMIPAAGLFTQTLWGQLADRTGSRRLVLASAVTGAGLAWLLLGTFESFTAVWLGTALMAAFAGAVLPMATAATLAAVRSARRFGPIRMVGTLGFLAMVVLFPRAVEQLDAAAAGQWARRALGGLAIHWQGLGWLFPATLLLCLAAALAVLALPSSDALAIRAQPGEARRILLHHPPVVRLLALVFLAHLAMQGPINLFPLYVVERGGDAAMVGRLWIFMLLLEIPLIGFSGATLRRLGARGLLRMGLLAEGVRWTVCAWSTDIFWISAAQLLHGLGVAGVLIGGPLYLERATPERLRSTGQTLISTVGYSAGAIVSNILVGRLFERFGPEVPYGAAGLLLLVLAVGVSRWLPEPWRPEGEEAAEE